MDESRDAEFIESSGAISFFVQAISVDPAFGTDDLEVMIAFAGPGDIAGTFTPMMHACCF